MDERIINRILDLIMEDEELHTAVIEALEAYRFAQIELGNWRARRK